MQTIQINRRYLLETLKDLVSINSINPSLDPEGPGEAEIAQYVANAMREIGLDVTVQQLAPRRFNVIGKLAGKGKGHSLMLNSHMDTVGVYTMPDPFNPQIRDGKLFGRGAYDMKGSLAACLAAAKALVDSKVALWGDLFLTAVADEEYISIGTENIVKQITTDGAIVTEPTGLRTCIAHKGYQWIEIETIGKAAHGSRYQVGRDANLMMGQVLAKLETLSKELIHRPPHPLTGPPSLHTSTLHGGTEWSIYPAKCKLQIERRTIPGEKPEEIIREFQTILDECRTQDKDFSAQMQIFFSREPFEIAPDAHLVQTIQQAAQTHLGKTPPLMGESFWMDSAILASAGIETVVFGPKGDGAHAQIEWVDLDSVHDTAAILAITAENYCNTPKIQDNSSPIATNTR